MRKTEGDQARVAEEGEPRKARGHEETKEVDEVEGPPQLSLARSLHSRASSSAPLSRASRAPVPVNDSDEFPHPPPLNGHPRP